MAYVSVKFDTFRPVVVSRKYHSIQNLSRIILHKDFAKSNIIMVSCYVD